MGTTGINQAHPVTVKDQAVHATPDKLRPVKAVAAPAKATPPKVQSVAQASAGVATLNQSISGVLTSLVSVLTQLVQVLQSKLGSAAGSGAVDAASGATVASAPSKTGVMGVSGSGVTSGSAALNPFAGQGQEGSSYAQQVVVLINQERAKYGLGALTYNPLLDQAAAGHDGQMERTNTMAHEGIGDGDPGSRIRATGFTNAWGENVAMGQLTPQQVVTEWMNSPEHKANILNPAFTQTGVNFGTSGSGENFWDQEFGA